MTQRTQAGLVAAILLGALVAVAIFKPLPFVTYEPGGTVDVLGETDGQEIIEITGRQTYRDPGELRMTTVLVSTPDARNDVFTLMASWLNPDDSLYPFDAIYAPDETVEQRREEGQIDMVTSQDAATAVALTELGYDFTEAVEVTSVTPETPADGKLEVRDKLLKVNDVTITDPDDVAQAVTDAKPGEPIVFKVRRGGADGKVLTVRVTPTTIDGHQRVGIRIGVGYEFPFDVTVHISPTIGGPSAGLMFALGIYDTLTPGSLTGDQSVAGTGTIDVDGNVGPIGGIQQKIVGARESGAELFLVPKDNCGEAIQARNGDMRLVRVDTMHTAVEAIEDWVEDPDAALPACPTASDEKAPA